MTALDNTLKVIRERLTEDDFGWDYYDDDPWDARRDLKTLVRLLKEVEL